MNNNRTSSRFSSYAKVLMDGIPGYMRDISHEGFKYVTIMPVNASLQEKKPVQVLPENSELNPFTLSGEIRWVRTDAEGFQVCGIKILAFDTPEGEKSYKKLEEQFSS